jgi:hypothetical protein
MDSTAAPTVWGELTVSAEGPTLVSMMSRLRATPAELTETAVDPDALVADTLDLINPAPLQTVLADALAGRYPPAQRYAPAHTAAVAVSCWLLSSPELVAVFPYPRRVHAITAINALCGFSDSVPTVEWLGADPERQEEVARAVLRSLGLRPGGESHVIAEDRWTSVSTRSRTAALAQAARDQLRAEELAAALAKKKAEEAAAQYSHV